MSEPGSNRPAVTTASPEVDPTREVSDPPKSPGRNRLLMTKLARPRIPQTYVPRSQVVPLLDQGAEGALTVVSAGAGWGKTLTTAAWAQRGPAAGAAAWVSLDESDNEPRSFWAYVLAALRRTVTLPSSNPLSGLDPALGREDENLRRLTAGINELPQPVVLIIDDFHLIQEPAVLAGVSELLRHPLTALRIVLLTRADPALPLHRLRIDGQLSEIRASDLAFNVDEAASLLAENGIAVDRDQAGLLVDRTEGWPAGLRLAALFLARRDDARSAADFAGDDRAVTDYLVEEVLASQPRELRDFLMRTSVAERVTSELAEVLTDEPRSQHLLETLERANAFVVGLGTDRRWFRYHPLLREMLQHELSVNKPTATAGLHRRAAQWFADSGHPVEALRHASQAQDWVLFGRLFVEQAAPLLVSTDRTALGRVLAEIPPQRFADSAEMALCAAGLMFHRLRIEDMQRYLDLAAAQLIDRAPSSSAGAQVTLRIFGSALARVRGEVDTVVSLTTEALDLLAGPAVALPSANEYEAVALGNLGTGLLWSGRTEEAELRLRAGLVVADQTQLEATRISLLGHLAVNAVLEGRLHAGYAMASEAAELVESRGWAPLPQASAAFLALAMVHVRWNNLEEARSRLQEGLDVPVFELLPRYALTLTLATLEASEGRAEVARQQLERLRTQAGDWQPPGYLHRWRMVAEAEVDLASGNPVAAVTRMRRLEAAGELAPAETVCLAGALLANGEASAAGTILAPLLSAGEQRVVEVDAWVLSALVADRLREDNQALDAMHRALDLARAEGVRRPFVTIAPEQVHRLVSHLRQLDPSVTEFADELLTDLRTDAAPSTACPMLPEPLTDRELSVLRHLPTMMTNAEIAAELFVSVNTVKAHLKRIYSKLDVASRRDAVHRAHDLGLIHG